MKYDESTYFKPKEGNEIYKMGQVGRVRTKEFFLGGYNGPVFVENFADDTMISNSRQWDIVWPDGDFWKGGMMSQGLYISPDKDLVIVYFSLNATDRSIDRYLRPIANSKLIQR